MSVFHTISHKKKNKKEKIYNHWEFNQSNLLYKDHGFNSSFVQVQNQIFSTQQKYIKCQFCFVAKNKIK